MRRYSTYSKEDILRVIKELIFCTRRQILLSLRGSEKRMKALEYWLPELEETQEIEVCWFQGVKVYSAARRRRANVSVEHEVGVAECRVRLEVCRHDGIYVPGRRFKGMGIIPDGAIAYPNGNILAWEFTTRRNFSAGGVIKSKLTRYSNNLDAINNRFSRRTIVLFVIDDERWRVRDFILRNQPVGADFFWTDYQTFKQVPIGQQLTAEIYLWEDGKSYPLTSNE